MLQGFIYAAVAACTYGLIGLFSVPLMQEGLSFSTVNFFRFFLAGCMTLLFVLARKRSLQPLYIERSDIGKLLGVSAFYTFASLSFIAAFQIMDTGVVVTVQYCYPIFVIFLMVAFFGERFRFSTFIAALLICLGVAIFSLQDAFLGNSGVNITLWGMLVTIFSALQMALYVVSIHVAKFTCKSQFVTAMYIMFGSSLYCIAYGALTGDFSIPSSTQHWQDLALFALITGVVSNIALVYAVRFVGSSLTSILGGLEPATGMLVGVYFLGEQASWGNILGAACILCAVGLVAMMSQLRK